MRGKWIDKKRVDGRSDKTGPKKRKKRGTQRTNLIREQQPKPSLKGTNEEVPTIERYSKMGGGFYACCAVFSRGENNEPAGGGRYFRLLKENPQRCER